MSVLDRLSHRFEACFPVEPRAWRRVGRESEHPIVHADGTAADIALLWPHLLAAGDLVELREGDLLVGLEGPSCAFSAEVGRGTMEIIVGPHDDLHGMRDAYLGALERLLRAAEAEGLRVLGYGIQPLTPPSQALMSAKRRYHVLHEVLGEAWLWFGVTASEQTHVEVSRDEVIAATDLANLLAPWTVALTANSPVYAGADAGVCSAREAMMGRIHSEAHRHGMPSSAARTPRNWVARTFELDFLMDRADGAHMPVGRPFGDWAEAGCHDDARLFQAWQLHDHYIWNSARPRTAHGTLELRAPCQQPGADHMVPAALALGMVSAHRSLAALLTDRLGDEAWPAMRAWHGRAVGDGLAAEPPVDGLVEALLELAHGALVQRERGEERYLEPLLERAAARRNPAQVVREVFARGGIEALLDHTSLS